MTPKDEALKLAKDYLTDHQMGAHIITAIKQALAAPVQEPVGEVCGYYERGFDAEKTRYGKLYNQDLPLGIKLYTTPPNVATPLASQRPVPEERKSVRSTWVGLTAEQKLSLEIHGGKSDVMLAELVEGWLKEKNSD